MKIKQFEIWIADLNPQIGTEPGKMRPVVIIQSNLLNNHHPSTLICPITTNVHPAIHLLRVNLLKGESGMEKESSILIDQLRAIDNKRLMKKIGTLHDKKIQIIKNSISRILDLDY